MGFTLEPGSGGIFVGKDRVVEVLGFLAAEDFEDPVIPVAEGDFDRSGFLVHPDQHIHTRRFTLKVPDRVMRGAVDPLAIRVDRLLFPNR